MDDPSSSVPMGHSIGRPQRDWYGLCFSVPNSGPTVLCPNSPYVALDDTHGRAAYAVSISDRTETDLFIGPPPELSRP